MLLDFETTIMLVGVTILTILSIIALVHANME